MPLLDHFHPPLALRRHWESFHAAWATALADALNTELLPEGYFAEELISIGGRIEIDVAAWEERVDGSAASTAVATQVWTPPAPPLTMPAIFPDSFAVRVFHSEGGPTLVASIELVSPGNKDRAASRLAFANKCASVLHEGLGLIVVDIVTSRRCNLHNDLMKLMQQEARFHMQGDPHLCAVAYRPIRRGEQAEIDIWPHSLNLEQDLPRLPLALGGDLCVPIDLETTYADVCRRRVE